MSETRSCSSTLEVAADFVDVGHVERCEDGDEGHELDDALVHVAEQQAPHDEDDDWREELHHEVRQPRHAVHDILDDLRGVVEHEGWNNDRGEEVEQHHGDGREEQLEKVVSVLVRLEAHVEEYEEEGDVVEDSAVGGVGHGGVAESECQGQTEGHGPVLDLEVKARDHVGGRGSARVDCLFCLLYIV